MTERLHYVYGKYFPKSFISYDKVKKYVYGGRWPMTAGRQYTQSFRIIAAEGDGGVEFHAYIDKTKLAVFHPDNTVTMVATPGDVWRYNHTLSGNIHKLIPIYMKRVATGRYGVIAADEVVESLDNPERIGLINRWHRKAMAETHKQEYFQHLRLDLSTGKIINPKDMTPTVDEAKRKQWIDGLKRTRLTLRAMSRIGGLEHYTHNIASSYTYLGKDVVLRIAECVMAGGLDAATIDALAHSLTTWKRRRYNTTGEAIVSTFENLVKSHSREMRGHVGVLDFSEK